MTSYERFAAALAREPVDMLPVVITPWEATAKRWKSEGYLREDEDVAEHFGLDLRMGGWLESCADLDYKPEIIEENDETILIRDGNGATLRRYKLHDSTPEHVDFDFIE